MNNNDILRRIRYAFDFNDAKMIELFGLADHQVTRAVGGDVAPVAARAVAIERVTYQVVLIRNVAVAIPVDGFFVDAGRRAGRPPVGEVSVVADCAATRAPIDPQRIVGGICHGRQATCGHSGQSDHRTR